MFEMLHSLNKFIVSLCAVADPEGVHSNPPSTHTHTYTHTMYGLLQLGMMSMHSNLIPHNIWSASVRIDTIMHSISINVLPSGVLSIHSI